MARQQERREQHAIIPLERIVRAIFFFRGQKVMLDGDLAALYGVQTRVLVQAVKRNLNRFPDDFMFQLTWDEARALRSQSVILDGPGGQRLRSQSGTSRRGRHAKYRPYAFSEQGVAMLSSVLRSEQAIAVNIAIVRAFVRLRQLIAGNAELARRIEELEKKYTRHEDALKLIVQEINRLMEPPPAPPKPPIGFRPPV